jgi:hypothetical protein
MMKSSGSLTRLAASSISNQARGAPASAYNVCSR